MLGWVKSPRLSNSYSWQNLQIASDWNMTCSGDTPSKVLELLKGFKLSLLLLLLLSKLWSEQNPSHQINDMSVLGGGGGMQGVQDLRRRREWKILKLNHDDGWILGTQVGSFVEKNLWYSKCLELNFKMPWFSSRVTFSKPENFDMSTHLFFLLDAVSFWVGKSDKVHFSMSNKATLNNKNKLNCSIKSIDAPWT